MVQRYTNDFIKCTSCLRGNNFLVSVEKAKDGNYYYLTKCPKCGHFEEVKELTNKEAERYLPLKNIKS